MVSESPKLLLVEDEAIIALTERVLLEKNGYQVETVQSGEAAIAAVARDPRIDLILMDIDLGNGIDGTEAAEAILEERDMPVVFLSSHTEPEVVKKTDGITSYGYIVKHAGDTVLLASIKMAFRLYAANHSIARKNMALEAANEELRVMNEALLDTNRRMEWWDSIVRYVVEHDPGAVVILDADLRFLYVSKRFLTDYRVQDEEIIGKHHYEVFPEIPEKWREAHRRALAGEVVGSERDSFVRPDGQVDWTRWECRPWYDSEGGIGGIIIYSIVLDPPEKDSQVTPG